jgi:hypothetical protein
MSVPRLKLRMGLQRVRKPRSPSEPGFVAQMNRQVRALTDELHSILDQFEDATPEIVKDALQPTFDKSQAWCPVRTGELKASGYLEITGKTVEMGYGFGNKPWYTVFVHENLDQYHAPPTQAKFLERAMKEDMNAIFYRIGANYSQFAGFVGHATIGY